MNTTLAQVIMLPTNNYSQLIIHSDDKKLVWLEGKSGIRIMSPQHLYFISNDPEEEIKKGDWITDGIYVSYCNSTFWQQILYFKQNSIVRYKSYKKIVASTDSALGLPTIPLTWIRNVYVPSNGSIKEVRLETYRHVENVEVVNGVEPVYSDRLRLTPKNKVVIVDEPIMLGENGKRITQHLKDKKVELQQRVDAKADSLNVDQELEDAAKEHIDAKMGGSEYRLEFPNDSYMTARMQSFKDGATWKAEQSATDAIEFAEWCSSTRYRYDPIYKTWRYDADSYTSKELYELWQQNKKK